MHKSDEPRIISPHARRDPATSMSDLWSDKTHWTSTKLAFITRHLVDEQKYSQK